MTDTPAPVSIPDPKLIQPLAEALLQIAMDLEHTWRIDRSDAIALVIAASQIVVIG